jgi:hypothetical protein
MVGQDLLDVVFSVPRTPDGRLDLLGAQFVNRPYAAHTRGDTAAIIAHFNPAGWKKPPKLLYDTCEALLVSGAHIVVVQLMAHDATPAAVPPGVTNVVYRSNAVLFHKENLFNLGVQHTDAAKFMFLDGDLIFSRSDIFDAVSLALDACHVLQPYQVCAWLDAENSVFLTRQSAADGIKHDIAPIPGHVHPGFAWAMTRQFYDNIGGLYDRHPLGSGDTALSFALFRGEPPFPVIANDAFVFTPSWGAFRERVQTCKPVVGVVPGALYHLWHGTREKRQYAERWRYLPVAQGDEYPLQRREDGVLEWTNPAHSEVLRNYFLSRDEDHEA